MDETKKLKTVVSALRHENERLRAALSKTPQVCLCDCHQRGWCSWCRRFHGIKIVVSKEGQGAKPDSSATPKRRSR